MRVVWLDGGLVAPGDAHLSIDDPGVRWGEGLFETMRAVDGRVPLRDRHLARLEASAAALGLSPMPSAAEAAAAVDAALAAFGPGPARVRLTATPRPTLLVEVVADDPHPAAPSAVTAVTVVGAWLPGDATAEHKTLSYLRHRGSQRRAEAAGADHALLLDDRGRVGEAALASVVWADADGLATAPVRGLLPGVARAVVMESLDVREEALDLRRRDGAAEVVLVNAVRGAMAVVAIDGRAVGSGAPGPWARRIARALSGTH
ncbi:aminotransferase class IV [Miltoncostaea oceani]|jgi:branched-chain amino acid aminotransferase|uniref:aminotransferase class IV n=1 Tax=Miltoncostaea oceani TaxID=2843216 RepID=UPI001C3C9745|nr:aminotransferase class IV [Miltoncostaea oceani]